MPSLVSIVIPCYNAEKWIKEAIQSVLDQTYSPIEIIVIDDGSTDKSLGIIRSFGSSLRWESGPNRGGNAARNRGVELSKGEFIQFLDADDYLLPEKINNDVRSLATSGADIVFGNWRHQTHLPNGNVIMSPWSRHERQNDYLLSVLSGWWTPSMTLLFRRSIVLKGGKWDESLQAAQDKDFLLTRLIAGGKVEFHCGCHSIYRRYGPVSVSSSKTLRWLRSHRQVLDKAKRALADSGRLTPLYCKALAASYFSLARRSFEFDRKFYKMLMAEVLQLDESFTPQVSPTYGVAQRMFGFIAAETLSCWKRKIIPSKSMTGFEGLQG